MNRSYRFADFQLIPARRELWRGGALVAVPPRAFDAIVYLVEHRDRAIGRDELIAAVWGRTEVSDGLLAQTVLAMRRAFDDTGKEQHFVRTVVRFGYHWVAPTSGETEAPVPATSIATRETATAVAEDLPQTTAKTEAAEAIDSTIDRSSRRASRNGSRRFFAVAGALLVVAALAFVAIRRHDGARTAASASPTAAHAQTALVLPFEISGGAEWMRLGLMDHVAARLRAAGLPVLPSESVVVLAAQARERNDADPAALAAAIGASLVVETHAEPARNGWRVHLRTHGGNALDASGESDDVLVAARIAADELARGLGLAPVATDTAEPGLDALLQKVEAATLNDRLDDARALLAQATPAQRESPEVRLRLAQIDYQAGNLPAAETAFAAIAKEVSAEQDPVLHARALTDLGVLSALRNDNTTAASRFDEAIALLRGRAAPDALGKALNGRANVAGAMDQTELALQAFAEARGAFERSGNLLALALVDSNLAALDMRRERYAEALPVFQRASERFATFGMHAAELNALSGAAELQLALLEPDAALATEPRLRELVAAVADPARQRNGELTRLYVLAANGRTRDAVAGATSVLDLARRDDDEPAQARAQALIARLALARGDTAGAIEASTQSLAHFPAVDDAREEARAWFLHIEALLAGDRAPDAARAATDLTAFAAKAGDAASRLYADLAQARTSADPDAAGTWYARALGEADALRIPADLREVVAAYATWLIGRGDTGRAGALAERIAGFTARDFDSALLQARVHRALGDAALWRGAIARAQALAGDRIVPPELLPPAR